MNTNTSKPYEQSSHLKATRDPVQPDLPRDQASSAYLSDEARSKSKVLIFPLLSSDIDQIPANPDRPWGKLIEFRLPQE